MIETPNTLDKLVNDVDYLQYQVAMINDDIYKLNRFLRDFHDWKSHVNAELHRLGALVDKTSSSYENVTKLVSDDIWKILMNNYEGGEAVIGKERDGQTNQGVV